VGAVGLARLDAPRGPGYRGVVIVAHVPEYPSAPGRGAAAPSRARGGPGELRLPPAPHGAAAGGRGRESQAHLLVVLCGRATVAS